MTENTTRGARGLILPASTAPGNPAENTPLPDTIAELKRLGISPREVALDGGFMPGPTNQALTERAPERVFIAGRQEPPRLQQRHPRHPDPVKHSEPLQPEQPTHTENGRALTQRGRFYVLEFFRGK